MPDVEPGADVHLDGLVELGGLRLLDEADGLVRRVLALAVDLVAGPGVGPAALGPYAGTPTPLERAGAPVIFSARATACAVGSARFFSAVWCTRSRGNV